MAKDNPNDLRPIYESEGVSVWSSTESANESENKAIESACMGKFKYPTANACLSAIQRFKRKNMMDYYTCRFCGSFHLTSKGGDNS